MVSVPQHRLTSPANDQIAKDFVVHGCLELQDFLPLERVSALAEYVDTKNAEVHVDERSLRVGGDRFMTPMSVEGSLNDEEIYAPHDLMDVMARLLGDDFVLSCVTCVTALPQAPAQHRHRDHPGLFVSPIDHLCPSFAINVLIPLVPLTEHTGTTRMWPGTHRVNQAPLDVDDDAGVSPFVPLGSAILMDYRVVHEGTPNHSDSPRPILCLAYSRSWFVDTRNFGRLKPVDIGHEELASVRPSTLR